MSLLISVFMVALFFGAIWVIVTLILSIIRQINDFRHGKEKL